MPCALFQRLMPFFPKALVKNFSGISRKVATVRTPISYKKEAVCFPTIGILSTDSGARKSFSSPAIICFCALGLNSVVATFDTSLFTDKAMEMGSSLSFMILFCNSTAHLKVPKKRSMPLASI